jgi:hypothetical protein
VASSGCCRLNRNSIFWHLFPGKDDERGYQADKTGIILDEFTFKDLFFAGHCRRANLPNCCEKTHLEKLKK